MLLKSAFLMFIASTSAFAGCADAKLIGRWHWQGIDAVAVDTFAPDHTFSLERTGFEHHDIQKGTWQIERGHLIIVFQDGDATAYKIVRLNRHVLTLESKESGTETLSRIE